MLLNSLLSSFGIGFDIDPLTGIKVDSGLVSTEVEPLGSTSVSLIGSELVGVDLSEGVAISTLGNEVDVDSSGVAVSTSDSDVDVSSEGVVISTLGNEVDVDSSGVAVSTPDSEVNVSSEGGVVGGGDEVEVDLTEGVGINIGDLIGFTFDIPSDI